MILPKKKVLTSTGYGDPVYYHYYPVIGYMYRKRLENTVSLLGYNYDNLLEIGYGSGLLMPELSKRANNLSGIDTHERIESVNEMLKKENLSAKLANGDILNMNYPDNHFDVIVSVSVLEHIVELDKAVSEIFRVLKKGSSAILSFPVKNKITDSLFKLIGYNPSEIHPSSHRDILESVEKKFTVKSKVVFPAFLPMDYSLYMSIKCTKV